MYRSTDDLPEDLKEELPRRARELYRAAYNRVIGKRTTGNGRDNEELQSTAHDAGMLAVNAEFIQDDSGRWHRDPIGDRTGESGSG